MFERHFRRSSRPAARSNVATATRCGRAAARRRSRHGPIAARLRAHRGSRR